MIQLQKESTNHTLSDATILTSIRARVGDIATCVNEFQLPKKLTPAVSSVKKLSPCSRGFALGRERERGVFAKRLASEEKI